MRIQLITLAVAALLLCGAALSAATPHDPYIYWLPSGALNKQASEFTVQLRTTRMGIPDADLVITRAANSSQTVDVSVNGKQMSERWTGAFYVIPSADFEGSKEVAITLSAATGPFKFYLTRDFREVTPAYRDAYDAALQQQFAGDWRGAQAAFLKLGLADRSGDLGRLCRMRARYCSYEQKSAQSGLTASARYQLGLYCMENGFWEAAAREFELATKLDPNSADSWYMLADSRAYRDGDSDHAVEPIIPLYRRSAQLRDTEPNCWNIYIGIFHRMMAEVGDGAGGTTKKLLEMSPEDARRIRKEWEWVSATIWAASKGNFKLNNTFKDIYEVYDNTDPHAFDNLWEPGEYDVFLKFFEGGPSFALGPDCGPNGSAVIDIGTWCGWEVYLHEWNHTLDWSMVSSENGIGVPVTHSSDWCGYQPIPCMGRGHASLNHYYMTGGMFQTVKESEVNKPGYNTNWTLYEPFIYESEEGLQQEFVNESATEFPLGVTVRTELEQDDPWIDLGAILNPASEKTVAYASAYVYSPVRQKVRMWLGMNDGIKVWLNGRSAYDGIYKAIVLWEEANKPDQVVPSVVLEEGWNSVLVKVENLAKTPEQLSKAGAAKNGWGFSLRLCDMRNRELPGVLWSTQKPSGWTAPKAFPDISERVHYRWSEVCDDYTVKLPCLSTEDLETWTGLSGITISKDSLITARGGGQPDMLDQYDAEDRALNNLFNWRFDSLAALRYTDKNNKPAHLVFMRPEAFETYMNLMKLPAGSGIENHADRVIGYVRVDGLEDHPNGRLMLVLDTFLGDRLPIDEKDLLDISSL